MTRDVCLILAQDRRGGVAILVGLMMVALVGVAGLAIDTARAYLAKDKFQSALDAAALAVGSSYGTQEELDALADRFVAQNYTLGGTRVSDVSVIATPETVTVTGTLDVDTYFMQLFQKPNITISASTEVKRAGGGLMVALVLDNTGSMWSNDNIGALRTASASLVDALYDDKTESDDLRVGVVPYSAAVNPGPVADDIIGRPRPYGVPDGDDETAWKGCVMERAGANALGDTSASVAEWAPFYYPPGVDNDYVVGDGDTIVPGGIRNSNQVTGPNIGCPTPIQPLTRYKRLVDASISSMSAWNRGGTLTDIGMAWGIRVLSPGAPFTESATEVDIRTGEAIWQSPRWRRAIVLMTDGESGFYNFPGGGAANQEGGSPNAAHPSASDFTAYGRKDDPGSIAEAIMSFGPGYVAADGTIDTSERGRLNRRIFDLCEAAKGEGIVVYTVVFTSRVSQSTRDMYARCASDPGKYWYAPDADALDTAFGQVGADLSKLRITR